jgi:hypothetical protein
MRSDLERFYFIRIKRIVLFLILSVLSFFAYSQEEVSDTIYDEYEYYEEDDTVYTSDYIGELNLSIKSSFGQMDEEFHIVPIGFNVGVYKQLKKTIPMYFGAGFYYEKYASNSLDYINNSPEDGYEYNYSDNFSANIIGLDIGAKYFSKKSLWRFNPFTQFNIKFRRAYSLVNTVNIDIDETENSMFEGGNYSIGYSLGFGSIIDINKDHYFLNFSIEYSGGGGLFLYKSNYQESANYVTDLYDYKYTSLSFMTIKLGIVFM